MTLESVFEDLSRCGSLRSIASRGFGAEGCGAFCCLWGFGFEAKAVCLRAYTGPEPRHAGFLQESVNLASS